MSGDDYFNPFLLSIMFSSKQVMTCFEENIMDDDNNNNNNNGLKTLVIFLKISSDNTVAL